MADVQRARFASHGGGDRLIRVVLVLWQEHVQRRRRDDLRRVLIGVLQANTDENKHCHQGRWCTIDPGRNSTRGVQHKPTVDSTDTVAMLAHYLGFLFVLFFPGDSSIMQQANSVCFEMEVQRRSLRSGANKEDRQEKDQTDIGLFANRVRLLPHLCTKVPHGKEEGKNKEQPNTLAA